MTAQEARQFAQKKMDETRRIAQNAIAPIDKPIDELIGEVFAQHNHLRDKAQRGGFNDLDAF